PTEIIKSHSACRAVGNYATKCDWAGNEKEWKKKDHVGCGGLSKRLRCEWTGPAGPLNKCCLFEDPGDGLTCSKDNYAGHPSCDDTLRTYCYGKNIDNDMFCRKWCDKRPDQCRDAMVRHCKDRFKYGGITDECKAFCNKDENRADCLDA